MFRDIFLINSAVIFSLLICPSSSLANAPGDLLVTVNESQITKGDLAFFMLSRNIPAERQAALRKQSLKVLIERRLMSQFLASRKAIVDKKLIEAQVKRIHQLISKKGDNPQQVLKNMGFTPQRLKEELQLPLAWGQQARLMISDQQLRQYYKKYQSKFDGSQVRAKHIFIKLNKESTVEEEQQGKKKLIDLMNQINAGELSFDDAAKQHSESPSKKEGGNVGLIGYSGAMPATFCAAAFQLKVNEISKPVRSPFGLHLITITERQQGDLSLEDVRAIVFNQLAGELWIGLVQQQRKKANIQWHEEKSSLIN